MSSKISDLDIHGILNPAHRRARPQLSCTHCRAGKLKCNRGHPCDQCVRRARGSQCEYVAAPAKKKPNQNMKERVKNLEKLVVKLMREERPLPEGFLKSDRNQQPISPSSTPQSHKNMRGSGPSGSPPGEGPSDQADVDDLIQPIGILQVSKDETAYVESSHWISVLEDIAEVKAYMEEQDNTFNDDMATSGEYQQGASAPHNPITSEEKDEGQAAGLLIGGSSPKTREEIISSLPPREVVDHLVEQWLLYPEGSSICIHPPTFRKECARFWEDPSGTPMMWIAMLFAMIGIAARIELWGGSDLTQQAAPLDYERPDPSFLQQCSSAALKLADYTKPKRHTIEALILFIMSDVIMSGSFSMKSWLLSGAMVRVSLRMGYHRDPDHYGNTVSPFDGEMRRRIWNVVRQLDTITSFYMGLPSIVDSVSSDTRLPANLYDSDLYPECISIPPSRPCTEVTPMTYMLLKTRTFRILSDSTNISQLSQGFQIEDILRVDRMLEDAYNELPEQLKLKALLQADPMSRDSRRLLICAFNLVLVHFRSKCVLHRRSVKLAWTDPRYEYSRMEAIRSSLELLRHHQMIHQACQAGGPLSHSPWYINSLNIHEFLTAAMVLCLELSRYSKKSLSPPPLSTARDHGFQGSSRALELQEICAAVHRSYNIFSQLGVHGGPMKKAATTMHKIVYNILPVIDRMLGRQRAGDEGASQETIIETLGNDALSGSSPKRGGGDTPPEERSQKSKGQSSFITTTGEKMKVLHINSPEPFLTDMITRFASPINSSQLAKVKEYQKQLQQGQESELPEQHVISPSVQPEYNMPPPPLPAKPFAVQDSGLSLEGQPNVLDGANSQLYIQSDMDLLSGIPIPEVSQFGVNWGDALNQQQRQQRHLQEQQQQLPPPQQQQQQQYPFPTINSATPNQPFGITAATSEPINTTTQQPGPAGTQFNSIDDIFSVNDIDWSMWDKYITEDSAMTDLNASFSIPDLL